MHIIPLNIGDFSQATERFKPVHLGIFLRLLMEYYKTENALPSVAADLEWIAGVENKSEREALAFVLRRCFVLDEGRNVWVQRRVERELEQYRANGVQKRYAILCRWWEKVNPGIKCPTLEAFTESPSKYYDDATRRVRVFSARNTLVLASYDDCNTDLPKLNYDTVTSNQEPVNSNQNTPIVPKGTDTRGPSEASIAEAIYALYPRKEAKKAALRAILKILKSGKIKELELQNRVRLYAAAVSTWSDSVRYTKEGSDTVPHPATWFNQERYNDDPAVWQRKNPVGSNPGSHPQKKEWGRPAPEIGAQDIGLGLGDDDEEPLGWVDVWVDLYDSAVPDTWADVPQAMRERLSQEIWEKKERGAA